MSGLPIPSPLSRDEPERLLEALSQKFDDAVVAWVTEHDGEIPLAVVWRPVGAREATVVLGAVQDAGPDLEHVCPGISAYLGATKIAPGHFFCVVLTEGRNQLIECQLLGKEGTSS